MAKKKSTAKTDAAAATSSGVLRFEPFFAKVKEELGGADSGQPSTPEQNVSDDRVVSDFQACDDLARRGQTRGPFIEANIDRIGVWKKAAHSGDARGQVLYGLCFFYGHGIEEDEEEAAKWFRLAAEQGNAQGQFSLGQCYYHGLGIEKDKEEAVKWFRLSAEQGHADAQFELGQCYLGGSGIEEDEEEAVKWFRLAAEQGNADAQVALGQCYHRGRGIEKDVEEAAKWFRLAAEQGNADAQVALGQKRGRNMSDDNVLTKEIAEQFLADNNSVDLSEFTAIEDDAAEVLSGYEESLYLSGVTILSDAAAESFSTHVGDLYFSGIHCLSDAAAQSLSKHQGHLDLSGLEELPMDAAASLGKHQGVVDLSGLTSLCGVAASVFQNINKLAPVKLFEKFTDEMETLYHEAKEKQQDDVNDACFYIHHSGLNSHEAFIEFYNVLSDCLCFPLWVMDDQENERCDFFKGTQRHVMALLKQIANGD